jgi:putative membrane protein
MASFRRVVYLAIFCLMMGAMLTLAQNQPSMSKTSKSSPGFSMADQKFLKQAADGGKAELEVGQLAVGKASSAEVKKFGERMVDDHGKPNEQLRSIAGQKGVTLPSQPSAKHRATKERLSKLSGEQFDSAYMAEMLKDHQKDVSEFRRESQTAKDRDVKNFAAKTLRTLQDHLKQAQSLAPKNSERSAMQEPGSAQR